MAGIDGLYWWNSQGKAAAVYSGSLYIITESGGSYSAAQIAGDSLVTGTPASFAEFGSELYIANGSQILRYVDGNTMASFLSDEDAPTEVTHLVVFNQYLLALEKDSARVWFSDLNAPVVWKGEFFTAEMEKDDLVSMQTSWQELVLFGETTIEVWVDSTDPSAPFQRLDGASTDRGVIAQYSVQKIAGTYYFLDNEKRVSRLTERTPQIISTPVEKWFQDLSTVSDCRSFHLIVDGNDLYGLTFPTDDKTYLYDVRREEWYEWSFWNGSAYSRFKGETAIFAKDWGIHLVGAYDSGKIYQISRSYYQDFGNSIRTLFQTGWLSHGTEMAKRSSRVIMRMLRGQGSGTPTLSWRWRDNGNTTYVAARSIDLGTSGDDEHIVRERRLGRYRSRQHQLFSTANAPLDIASVEEAVKTNEQAEDD